MGEQNKTKNNKPIRKTGKVQAMEGHKLSQMTEDTNQSNSTAEALNFEHQISVDAKKIKRKKDKIVVSKLAKSDRPLREKSLEKQTKEKSTESGLRRDENEDSSSIDYSATLNRKKKDQFVLGKFTRSISQPGPPENTDLILSDIIFNDSGKQANLKRNLSFTQKERKSSAKLKRSSTAKESYERSCQSNKVFEQKDQSEKQHEQKNESSLSLYDNLGYDRSPDVRQKLKSLDKRQQTLQNLKEQINCQLNKTSINSPGSSISLTSTAKRKINKPKDNPNICQKLQSLIAPIVTTYSLH